MVNALVCSSKDEHKDKFVLASKVVHVEESTPAGVDKSDESATTKSKDESSGDTAVSS